MRPLYQKLDDQGSDTETDSASVSV